MHGERLFFNEEERISFIQTTDRAENQKTRTFCSLLHYTGCNFTEAMKFTPQQVDFDAKVIAFPGPHHSQFSRTIPVPDSFLDLLDGCMASAISGPVCKPGNGCGLCPKEGLHKQVRRVIAEAGIPEGPHAVPKGIRHGFFVHALRRRVMITRLQKWMGHSFPEYTAQYVADLLRQAPELLGDERADAERMWSIDSGHSFQS